MASEIRTFKATGKTIDACILQPSTGYVWYPAGETWEVWGTGSRTRADYAAASIDEVVSGMGYYIGDFPTDITTAGTYDIQLTERAGANPADGDTVLENDLTPQVSWTGSEAAEEEVVSVTATALCNYALSKIGGGGESPGNFRLDSIYDSSDTGALCIALYPQIRKEVLCRAWWAEATKYAELAAELSGIDRGDWEYAFNLPSDYLGRAKQISESYHRSTKARYIPEYDKEIVAGMLFTNHYSNADDDSAYIKYIFNLTDVTEFSPLLYNAIATKLAAELSPALLADKGGLRRYFLLQEFERLALPLAEGANAEQQGDDEDEGEYTALTCRTP